MSELAQPRRRWSVRRANRRVERALAASLEPGEAVRSVLYVQRYVPMMNILLLLGALGDLVFVAIARPYYFAVTDQRFFVLKAGRIYPRVGSALTTSPLNNVRFEDGRRWLIRKTVEVRMLSGDDYRVGVHRVYWRELDYMESIAKLHGAG